VLGVLVVVVLAVLCAVASGIGGVWVVVLFFRDSLESGVH
jgi:hypothetical protein